MRTYYPGCDPVPDDVWWDDPTQAERDYEHGASLGNPRRCRRHPDQVTSSPDGMFDAPCGACEAEMDTDRPVTAADLFGYAPGGDDSIPSGPAHWPDDGIPF